eukprot:Gregarina_sp_Poly_1__2193@NODE_1583_length_3789_cov_73_608006_g1045_i0_p2_GENE_NODE_1583_length_3789_cov_73_608006_g1045_i0NODE_1583_length_3789_cov_73_608006_g1045_i0_p2_ORF_typecomplete_len400_score56_25Pkinase/PF00069_25/8_5e61Pkinase_Tyr/PF07714_17/1_2e39Kinaselike/PF14531_6/8_2e12Kinaselike/PF14531_6/5_5Kdo/PF06293_14/8_2e10RIO1/PF01163_22/1_9e08RIO1/PF01163_22/8_6e03WaaY/PF06176_11/1_1e07Pkinase_fungal/PF17667_1/2_6e07APH/PF01636_23/0_33Seadorna_VP7/PF07387_11/0_1_NODE_1583_length_3789_cov
MGRWDDDEEPRPPPSLSLEIRKQEEAKIAEEISKYEHLRDTRRRSLIEGCRLLEEHYELLNKISEGSYGTVFRGKRKRDGLVVALKSIKVLEILKPEGFPIAALREFSGLLDLAHGNIVEVFEVVVDKYDRVFMVMEYIEHELRILLQINKPEFSISEKKQLILQLLQGLEFIHSRGYLHRDLKTANVLYSNGGLIKLCDFGQAKKCFTDVHTSNVSTMWYRSPEMLLGQQHYSQEVDVWAAGCVMAEILLGKPLFQESSETAMLKAITSLMGTEAMSAVPALQETVKMFPICRSSWRSKFTQSVASFEFSALTDEGLNLLKRLLEPHPALRITASEAVQHKYFTESPLPQRLIYMPTAPDTNKSVHRRRDSSSEDEERMSRQRVNAKRYIQQMTRQIG